MSELDDILDNALEFWPEENETYLDSTVKQKIKNLMLDNDPDFGRDIQAFYTDSVYADLSDSERDLLVKDRIDEHNQRIKEL